jgi:sirohydrochlorin cobaltochelatase
VAQAAQEGRRTIVIPFRLFGFGPYAEVLEGQEYVADKRGLLPHENVTRWISRQVEELRSGSLRVGQR